MASHDVAGSISLALGGVGTDGGFGGSQSIHAAYMRASCWHALGEYARAVGEYGRCVDMSMPPRHSQHQQSQQHPQQQSQQRQQSQSEEDLGFMRAAHYQGECALWMSAMKSTPARGAGRHSTDHRNIGIAGVSGGGISADVDEDMPVISPHRTGASSSFDGAMASGFKLAWCKKSDPASLPPECARLPRPKPSSAAPMDFVELCEEGDDKEEADGRGGVGGGGGGEVGGGGGGGGCGGGSEVHAKAVKRLLAGLRRLSLGRRIQYRTEGFFRNLRQHAMASLAMTEVAQSAAASWRQQPQHDAACATAASGHSTPLLGRVVHVELSLKALCYSS